MRLLSNRRHSPVLRTMLLGLVLLVLGLLYAGASPVSQSRADGTMSTQVAQGKALFEVGCSSCHGLNGEGTSLGPSVVGTGSASVDFQVGTGRMPAAAPGAQIPVKPKIYTDEEIAALGAYVDSLGPGVVVPKREQYDASTLGEGDQAERDRAIARGGELFRTNCSACHNFAGSGGALPDGKYAPSLVGVEDKFIWEAIRTGPQQMPVFSSEVITDEDTKAIIAYLDTLHSQPNQGGFSLGGLGPVSEGFWAWVFGIGSLVGFAVWIAARGAKAR